jgi:hypothetical protein
MVTLPLLFGAVLAGAGAPAAWLVPPSAVLAFLSRSAWVPVLQRRRRGKAGPAGWAARRAFWGSVFGAGAVAGFAGIVAWTPPAARFPMLVTALAAAACGGVYAAAEALGSGRRVGIELVGMAGLALSTPVMALAAGREPGAGMYAAAALAFAYFAASLAFVRAYGRLREHRTSAVVSCLASHGLLAAGLTGLVLEGWLTAWALAAFAPVVVRAVWGLARPPRNLRGLGLREIWVATSFAAMGLIGLAM